MLKAAGNLGLAGTRRPFDQENLSWAGGSVGGRTRHETLRGLLPCLLVELVYTCEALPRRGRHYVEVAHLGELSMNGRKCKGRYHVDLIQGDGAEDICHSGWVRYIEGTVSPMRFSLPLTRMVPSFFILIAVRTFTYLSVM
jgi:hypothetical protein